MNNLNSIIFVSILLLAPFSTKADERCGPGRIFDRGIIGCVQEFCPPTAGRNIDGICQCSNSEWGGEQRTDCRSPVGLLTHCATKNQTCDTPNGKFDPATGITSFGTFTPDAPESESSYTVIRFFQRIYRSFRDRGESVGRDTRFVILGVMGKVRSWFGR